MSVVDEVKLEELVKLPLEEHAGVIARLRDEITPFLIQFEGRAKMERPGDAEFLRRADWAQFGVRKLKEEIERITPSAVAI